MTKKDTLDNQLTSIPNDKYGKFFAKFAEIETLPVEQWGKSHLLGYFCKLYHSTYQVEYPWKFNHQNPNKCFEVWQLNTLCAKLSANPKILKEYMDWAFQTLIPKAKRRLTSISFMTKDEVVNPYKMDILLGNKKNLNVDRSAPLPDKYRQVFGNIGIEVHTHGDVAFLANMTQTPEIARAFEELQVLGFDKDILTRIV
jgi:hypothetical protein